jgi:hypothetical protein
MGGKIGVEDLQSLALILYSSDMRYPFYNVPVNRVLFRSLKQSPSFFLTIILKAKFMNDQRPLVFMDIYSFPKANINASLPYPLYSPQINVPIISYFDPIV